MKLFDEISDIINTVKSFIKKIVLTFYPVLFSLLARATCGLIAALAEKDGILQGVIINSTSFYAILVVPCQIIEIVVYGFWYIRKFKPPHEKNKGIKNKKETAISFITIISFFISFNLFVDNIYALLIKTNLVSSQNDSDFYIWDLISMIIVVCIITPLEEELIYRGICFNIARAVELPFWFSNIFQATTFALLHGDIVQKIYAFIAAFFFGILYEKYKKLWIPLSLHMLFNLWGLLLTEYSMQYSIVINSILTIISLVLAICTIIYYHKKHKIQPIGKTE